MVYKRKAQKAQALKILTFASDHVIYRTGGIAVLSVAFAIIISAGK